MARIYLPDFKGVTSMAELCSRVPGSPCSRTSTLAPSRRDNAVLEQTKPASPFALIATGMIPQFSLRPGFPGAFPPLWKCHLPGLAVTQTGTLISASLQNRHGLVMDKMGIQASSLPDPPDRDLGQNHSFVHQRKGREPAQCS